MIPIECPKCGRGGRVPPDRLNSRLVCKACHTVFHLDNTGHLILGEPEGPGGPATKQAKPRAEKAVSVEDFDLAQTWKDIPKPVRYGVPAVLLAMIAYLNVGSGESTPDYFNRADSVIYALASNNRSKVVSYASSDSAEAAGKWFDLLHGELEKGQFGSNVTVSPNLFNGNPAKDSELNLMMIVAKPGSPDTLTVHLTMKREASDWKVDGTRSLADARSSTATASKAH